MRSLARRRLGVCLLVALVFAGPAAARPRHRPLYRPTFRLVSHHVGEVLADDRYVFIEKPICHFDPSIQHLVCDGEHETLIDERTGRRTGIPGCSGQAMFGGPWLLLDCGQANAPEPELYRLSTGRPVLVHLPHGGECGSYSTIAGACAVIGVGRHWIELLAMRCSSCAVTYLLQHIPSGLIQPADVTPGGHVAIDLDARSGERALCAPLRYPRSWSATLGRWQPGWLAFEGPVAIVSDSPPDWGRARFRYLERCGSTRRISIPDRSGPFLATTHEVVWPESASILSGVFLPSLRRFSVEVAGRVVALSLRHVFATVSQHEFWGDSMRQEVHGDTETAHSAGSSGAYVPPLA